MSSVYVSRETTRGVAATGTIADAVGGIAIIVLAIIGLGDAGAGMLTEIAVTVLGAALLAEGGAIATEFTQLYASSAGTEVSAEGAGMMSELMFGGGILVLGILSLIGVGGHVLPPVAIIAAGAFLLVSAPTMLQLGEMRRQSQGVPETAAPMLRASASSMSGIQVLAGLAAVVLGILVLAGAGSTAGAGAATAAHNSVLTLVALLVLGAALTFNGTALTGMVIRLIRR